MMRGVGAECLVQVVQTHAKTFFTKSLEDLPRQARGSIYKAQSDHPWVGDIYSEAFKIFDVTGCKRQIMSVGSRRDQAVH